MDLEYLKSDTKRIEKKFEELNKKYDVIQREKELELLEKRSKEINEGSDDNLKTQIWGDIYKDVLEIEKKTDVKPDKKKKK
jgi:chorismate mutase